MVISALLRNSLSANYSVKQAWEDFYEASPPGMFRASNIKVRWSAWGSAVVPEVCYACATAAASKAVRVMTAPSLASWHCS